MNFETRTHYQNWRDIESAYIMESTGGAMIRITKYADNEIYMVSDLYVNPALRKQGLGTLMIKSAIKECRAHARLNNIGSCIIEVEVNDRSEKFCPEWYQRIGFVFNKREGSMIDNELEWSDIYRLVL
jgi:GNAT superfamily N-acetyltransferase